MVSAEEAEEADSESNLGPSIETDSLVQGMVSVVVASEVAAAAAAAAVAVEVVYFLVGRCQLFHQALDLPVVLPVVPNNTVTGHATFRDSILGSHLALHDQPSGSPDNEHEQAHRECRQQCHLARLRFRGRADNPKCHRRKSNPCVSALR